MAKKVAIQLDLLLNPLLGLVVEQLAGDPTNLLSRLYYNTTVNELRFFDGTSWISAGGGSMSAAAILTALLTVDGAGSLLDADKLDGNEATAFALSGHGHVAADISDFDAAADARVAVVIDAAPGTLDTLNELAAALADDPDFSTTMTNLIAGKADTYSEQIGDAVATVFPITHNLGNLEAVATVYEVATGEEIIVDIKRDSPNQHTVTFASAPAVNEFEVVLTG